MALAAANRNAKRAILAKPVNRKTSVFQRQVLCLPALQDQKANRSPFLVVVSPSPDAAQRLLSVYENVNQAAAILSMPQITVYLQKAADDDAAAGVVAFEPSGGK